MKKSVIFGAGGFAREVYEIIKDFSESFEVLGFIDENTERHGSVMKGKPILGGMDWLSSNKEVEIILGIGSPAVKKKVVRKLREIHNFNFPTLIHPTALIGSDVTLGEGCIVCANSILTTDIKLGNYVTINLSCTIGHDSKIDDYSTVAPAVNISGNVTIGESSDLGSNSVIIQGITIGDKAVVGAGAVVIRNIPPNTTSVGNPSKVIKMNEQEEANVQ